MKKCCILLICALLLTGCTAAETFESIDDVYAEGEPALMRQVSLEIPEAAEVISSDAGTIYLCEGYEVTLQTMAAGDLNATMRSLTGFEADGLAMVETGLTETARYECVWTAAGEGGDTVGRALVLDDGCYHYCVTVMASENDAGALRQTWQALLETVQLS